MIINVLTTFESRGHQPPKTRPLNTACVAEDETTETSVSEVKFLFFEDGPTPCFPRVHSDCWFDEI